jgi:coenzyme PQQ precursor peptide PqqA
MIIRYRLGVRGEKDTPVAADAAQHLRTRIKPMRWETPQATDFRFGMEITMYIANR